MPALVRGSNNKAGVLAPVAGPSGESTRGVIDAVFSVRGVYPNGTDGSDATPVTAGSGNQANATATATIGAVAGKTAYIAGFDIVGTGATAASVVAPTLTGVVGGTKTYALAVVGGTVMQNPVLSLRFDPPIPASAPNTAIAVNCPALGVGSTNNTVNAYGFYL